MEFQVARERQGMRMKRQMTVVMVGLVVLMALVSLQGCTMGKRTVGQYFMDRGKDAAQIFEFGLTYSSKPQFAMYADGVSVACGGWGDVDGYFLGIGGGQVGWTKFYEKSVGLFVWGQETVGWTDYDVHDPPTLNTQGVGIAGIIMGPHPGPDYMPACVHYLHLGYLGVVANIRYYEALDFLAGWFFLDPSGDDGYDLGHYPWQLPRVKPLSAPTEPTEKPASGGES